MSKETLNKLVAMSTQCIIPRPSKKDIGLNIKSRTFRQPALRNHCTKWGDQFAVIVAYDKKAGTYDINVDGKEHTIKCDKLWDEWVIDNETRRC